MDVVLTEEQYNQLVGQGPCFLHYHSDQAEAATPYSLPLASSTVLGGIKVGANLTISGTGVLSATGSVSYTGSGPGTGYIPLFADASGKVITKTLLNGIIGSDYGHAYAVTIGSGLSLSGGTLSATGGASGTVTSVGMTVPTGLSISGSPITGAGTLALTLTAGYSIPTTASQTNWDTAYSDRNKWDGGSTGLVAATGRTSLGATTVGSNLFTLVNPSAVTFPRFNVDNTVSALDAATFRTAIGAGTSSTVGTVTSVGMSVPTGLSISGSPITSSGTLAVTMTAGYAIPTTASQTNWDTAYADRNKWDGGSTGLVAATGRTSLGATTIGGNMFTLVNPSAVTFPRFNADNTVSALDAATFRTAIGAGTSSTVGTVTSVSGTGTVSGLTLTGTVTSSGSLTLGGTLSVSTANVSGLAAFVGNVGQNTQSTSYTLALSDVGKSVDTSAGVTVPPNSTVAFVIGDVISVTNTSASNITITQGAGVTLRQAGTANTGNRTLAQYGLASLRKIATDTWIISGAGLT